MTEEIFNRLPHLFELVGPGVIDTEEYNRQTVALISDQGGYQVRNRLCTNSKCGSALYQVTQADCHDLSGYGLSSGVSCELTLSMIEQGGGIYSWGQTATFEINNPSDWGHGTRIRTHLRVPGFDGYFVLRPIGIEPKILSETQSSRL
jgi:hypothetical protein